MKTNMPPDDDNSAEKLALQKNKQRLMSRRSSVLTMVVALLFAAGALVFFTRFENPYETLKEESALPAGPAKVELFAFRKAVDGSLEPLASEAGAGEVIVFKVSTNLPINVSLAASINDLPPVVLFSNVRLPPGQKRLLERAFIVFSYEVLAEHKRLTFCVLYGENSELLQLVEQTVGARWAGLPPSSCVDLG